MLEICYLLCMSRQSRIDAPGALHHIIAGGIERKRIFTDGVDRDNFINQIVNIVSVHGTLKIENRNWKYGFHALYC